MGTVEGLLLDELGDEAGPAGLVGCAQARAAVAVEKFVKQKVILEIRICVKERIIAEAGAAAVIVRQKKVDQPASQLDRDLVKRHALP